MTSWFVLLIIAWVLIAAAYVLLVRPRFWRSMKLGGKPAGNASDGLYKWDAIVFGAFVVISLLGVFTGQFRGPPAGRGTDYANERYLDDRVSEGGRANSSSTPPPAGR